MFEIKKTTPEATLTAACGQAAELLSARAKIKGDLSTTNTAIETARDEERHLLSELGDELRDSKTTHKSLASTRQTIETQNARLASLRDKLNLNHQELLASRISLVAARDEAGAARLDVHRKKIIGAVTGLQALMKEVIAEDQGFGGQSNIRSWFALASFPDPGTGLNLLATHGAIEGQAGPAWAGNEKLSVLAAPEHQRIATQLDRELAAAAEVSPPLQWRQGA
jgi:hypothetical protein